MKHYYFTFGFGQEHQNGYVVIKAKNKKEAREKMVEKYGQKWSMEYENEVDAGVQRFNLHLVDIL